MTPTPVPTGASQALADPALRDNLRRAMDGLMGKRAAQFSDPEEWAALRARGAEAKLRALSRLPDLLEQLEQSCTANGIQVHWAETAEQANALIHGLLAARGAKTVVKGKSMATEEIHLNSYLQQRGLEVLESDLGEYIIQLAGEAPSHIIMPAIHLNRDQIARLFVDHIPDATYTEDVAELTALARQVLRQKFAMADAGITGVNFAVAETGTLCLVENEGNGRMSSTAPPLHIAVMGLDKVVDRLADVPPLLSLLTRSATGQPITTYFNMISGPRRCGEQDGPEEVHLVILDNGRSRIATDPELVDTLRCIRCGACMNHCPVYGRVGGHAYQATYPGPIGKILTPQLESSSDRCDLPLASSLCNACAEVCPVGIPIPRILVTLRNQAAAKGGKGRSRREDAVWKGWAQVYASPTLYAAASRVVQRVTPLMPSSSPVLREWTRSRTKPRPARKTLHQLAREEGFEDA